jgi:hypothetical protein
MRAAAIRLTLLPFLLFFASDLATSAPSADRQSISEALQWVRTPSRGIVQYDYIMTARVRLLVFWAGKDDVGGGYIRRGVSIDDPHQEFFQVLFGSDPAKAPRAINRWGAGTEVSLHKDPVKAVAANDDVTASAFFGFMKSSRGKSVSEMQEELRKEKDHGEHSFTGILSRVEPAQAISLVVNLQSDTDYNLHQFEMAEPLMLDKIGGSAQPVRSLQDQQRCPRAKEFLATVAELMDAGLAGQPAHVSRCYVYDAQENTLTLESVSLLPTMAVHLTGPSNSSLLDSSYSNLMQLDFVSTHKITGKKVYFSIVTGTQGELRAVPVQIRYQPNWWFQVVLNLRPATTAMRKETTVTEKR